ncbi:hypothetical protein QNI19_12180 [Cytophagaceae bacterium DM2B3-1]|uniref:TerB family tellurite resistance protein n=1 Tax=Xanthocytophaga flava TaxID=3048013 RepID=A0ABT7CIY0_9BACT|nr:hypothetical protein [Xanthocytophaga flavus]MDJ1493691.1 hypothetical protein [Xanthocytophaga flavus]
MKKLCILIGFFSVFSTVSYSQNVKEWLQQKKTQKEYLLKQIAALQVYIKFLKKGYSIAKDGLTFIGDIKDKEFSLHKNYFQSLDNVNPVVQNYSKISDILSLHVVIKETCKKDSKQIKSSQVLTSDEISYIQQVYERLLSECQQTVDHLSVLTTSNTLSMNDANRLSRIDDLYIQMQDHYTFLKQFHSETMILIASRIRSQKDIQTSHTLNGSSTQ